MRSKFGFMETESIETEMHNKAFKQAGKKPYGPENPATEFSDYENINAESHTRSVIEGDPYYGGAIEKLEYSVQHLTNIVSRLVQYLYEKGMTAEEVKQITKRY